MSESVRFTAAACLLAKEIYYARSEAFDLEPPMWDTLSTDQKALYITQASDILKANRPPETTSVLFQLGAGLARAHAAKVIGRIDPLTPWGESR